MGEEEFGRKARNGTKFEEEGLLKKSLGARYVFEVVENSGVWRSVDES